MIIGNQCGI